MHGVRHCDRGGLSETHHIPVPYIDKMRPRQIKWCYLLEVQSTDMLIFQVDAQGECSHVSAESREAPPL